jgi:hypothetical protein
MYHFSMKNNEGQSLLMEVLKGNFERDFECGSTERKKGNLKKPTPTVSVSFSQPSARIGKHLPDTQGEKRQPAFLAVLAD